MWKKLIQVKEHIIFYSLTQLRNDLENVLKKIQLVSSFSPSNIDLVADLLKPIMAVAQRDYDGMEVSLERQ